MNIDDATLLERERATRFFRGWLIGATCASVMGNVAHAVLGSAGSLVVAAPAAIVPPAVQLGMTYGVHVLVRSRIVGRAYMLALATVGVLALIAFVLSFAALRDLMIVWGGMSAFAAFLWPLAIDLSITGSTVALLELSNAQRAQHGARGEVSTAAPLCAPSASVHVEVHNSAQAVHAEVHAPVQTHTFDAEATRLVDDGVVRIDRAKVAEVLAAHAEGTAPSAIARQLKVGYNTVVRIVEHRSGTTAPAPEVIDQVTT